ncbi:hypothetical protein MMC31_007372 [Peltigera leucophlebia]|nr:hypothetical protein [Peltigera leucophlebia]
MYTQKLQQNGQMGYQGTARIKLEHLQFPWEELKGFDKKNANRLKLVFKTEGKCRREEPQNFISAVIDQDDLNRAMAESEVSAARLLDNREGLAPRLDFPAGFSLNCFDGQDRIRAARDFLPSGDRWWTVQLFTPDTSEDLKLFLSEQYSNEQKPHPGKIYRKVRRYQIQGNTDLELKWTSRLSNHQQICLKRLFLHKEITAAFDALLDIPGLWGGFMLSSLNKVLAMRCDELIIKYLANIKEVWSYLLGGDTHKMSLVDRATVEALELHAPRASSLDYEIITSKLRNRSIFSNFEDSERAEIERNVVLCTDCLIPSLFSFFRDVTYLQSLSNCLKWLTDLPPHATLFSAMSKKLTGEGKDILIQVTETKFRTQSGSLEDRVDFGWRQLFAFAMRYHREIPFHKKVTLAKPQLLNNKRIVELYAEVAYQLGYRSDKITAAKKNSFHTSYESNVVKPTFVTDGCNEPKKRRCGLPRLDAYRDHRESLYIDNLHSAIEETAEGITPLFVQRSIYLNFFGLPNPSPEMPEDQQPEMMTTEPHQNQHQSQPISPNLHNRDFEMSQALGSPQHPHQITDSISSGLQEQRINSNTAAPQREVSAESTNPNAGALLLQPPYPEVRSQDVVTYQNQLIPPTLHNRDAEKFWALEPPQKPLQITGSISPGLQSHRISSNTAALQREVTAENTSANAGALLVQSSPPEGQSSPSEVHSQHFVTTQPHQNQLIGPRLQYRDVEMSEALESPQLHQITDSISPRLQEQRINSDTVAPPREVFAESTNPNAGELLVQSNTQEMQSNSIDGTIFGQSNTPEAHGELVLYNGHRERESQKYKLWYLTMLTFHSGPNWDMGLDEIKCYNLFDWMRGMKNLTPKMSMYFAGHWELDDIFLQRFADQSEWDIIVIIGEPTSAEVEKMRLHAAKWLAELEREL